MEDFEEFNVLFNELKSKPEKIKKVDVNTSRKRNDYNVDTMNSSVNTQKKKNMVEVNTPKKNKAAKKKPDHEKGPLTVNHIFENVIEFTKGKKAKGYSRINKILTSHDKNRNYQSHICRDLVEILIEMKLIKGLE